MPRRGRSPERRELKRAKIEDDGDGPSEAEILDLVAQRESYRQQRNFAQSDAIREQLRSMGVELYDKEKEWKSKDGRRGSLFTAGPGESNLSDADIQDLVADREDARRAKDFSRADQIRDELRRSGVELDDKNSEWRTAGGRRGTYAGTLISSGSSSNSGGRLGVSAIRKLVAERERLRASMDFEAADELRRQLAQLGVELFDNERYWKSSEGHRGVIITGGHEADCFLTESEIQSRVNQREDARHRKDWGTADQIRDTLRSAGVELLDSQKQWITTDGRHGSYNASSSVGSASNLAAALTAAAAVPNNLAALGGQNAVATLLQAVAAGAAALPIGAAAPSRVSGGSGPSSPVTSSPSLMTFSTASIVALVSGRERCRDDKDWEGADAIRADLRSHGVDVWDKDKVWRANDGRSGSIVRLP